MTSVNDGTSALKAFKEAHKKKEPIDVVITDIQMPDPDGRELASLIRAYCKEEGIYCPSIYPASGAVPNDPEERKAFFEEKENEVFDSEFAFGKGGLMFLPDLEKMVETERKKKSLREVTARALEMHDEQAGDGVTDIRGLFGGGALASSVFGPQGVVGRAGFFGVNEATSETDAASSSSSSSSVGLTEVSGGSLFAKKSRLEVIPEEGKVLGGKDVASDDGLPSVGKASSLVSSAGMTVEKVLLGGK